MITITISLKSSLLKKKIKSIKVFLRIKEAFCFVLGEKAVFFVFFMNSDALPIMLNINSPV